MLGWMCTITIAGAMMGSVEADESHRLTVEQLYHARDQPLMVRVEPTSGSERPRLALMDPNGALFAEPTAVRPGRVDLGEVFRDLWTFRETMYLQWVGEDGPEGSALVLQPLLTPLVPRTEPHVHPSTGDIVPLIIGWDEPDERVFSGFRVYHEHDVMLHTTKGQIHLLMRPDHAPNTVWNFIALARGGLYDNVPFHRVVPLTSDGDPFVIQGGDPSETGLGGPGYNVALEPSRLAHDFGVISMARAEDPDSAGSQFFICLSREGTRRLDGQYSAFGYAIDGAHTILDIAEVELADVTAGRPADAPVIRRVELVPAPPRLLGIGRPESRIIREEPRETDAPGGRIPR